MTVLGQGRTCIIYLSIILAPRPCTTQMNSFFTGQRNLICSWWWCCQLCSRNCISSLNNEKLHNFSTPPLCEPGQSAGMVCQDGEDEEIGGGGSEPPTSSGSVESCLRVVAQPIRPLFSLYNPSFPPFPAHIRRGALSWHHRCSSTAYDL